MNTLLALVGSFRLLILITERDREYTVRDCKASNGDAGTAGVVYRNVCTGFTRVKNVGVPRDEGVLWLISIQVFLGIVLSP